MIRVANLHKSFRNQQVLKGINLEFATGKITTIVGTSGCGKTVLLKHLNALLRPDRGEVFVDGVNIVQLPQNNSTRFAANSAYSSRARRCSTR